MKHILSKMFVIKIISDLDPPESRDPDPNYINPGLLIKFFQFSVRYPTHLRRSYCTIVWTTCYLFRYSNEVL